MTGGAGVAMAFEPGHGRTAGPVRSALAGSVIAVAALAAAAVFGASLVGLVSTPHDYGQNWVQEVDFNFGSATGAQAGQMAQAIPSISGYAGGDYGQLTIDGRSCPRSGSTRYAAAATSRCWPAARRPPLTRSPSARRRSARSARVSARPCR